MDNPVLITRPEQLEEWRGATLAWPYDSEDLERHRVDAHWIYLDHDGNPAARCSLWWTDVPTACGQRVGMIGHYAAQSSSAATQVLQHATKELRRAGCGLAVGPMDGSTWRRYRLVTEPGERPPFFLEPDNAPDWLEHWTSAGFEIVAEYLSRVNLALDREDAHEHVAAERMERLGVRLRPLDLSRFERELVDLHSLITAAFRHSFLYTPLALEDFIRQYNRLRSRLVPELVTVAEHEGRVVGLLFGIPNWQEAGRGEAMRSTIIKTLVIAPERIYAGLGTCLAAQHHRCARTLGFAEVIHALMHQGNRSQNISARYGPVMRRYALCGKDL